MPSFASNFNGPIVRYRARNSGAPASEAMMNSFNSSTVKQNVQLPSAAAMDISSSSAADTAAGTGARTIEIYGLAGDYTFQSEIITLNGQTKVTTAKSFIRVFEIAVLTAGSGGVNAGDIYVVKTGTGGTYSGGVPGTLTSAFIKGLAGDNYGISGWYTTPAGCIYNISGLAITSRAQSADITLYQGFFDNGLQYRSLKISTTPAEPTYASFSIPLLVIPEKTDIFFTNQASSANGVVTAEAILVKQGA